jgi:hypothetical protein
VMAKLQGASAAAAAEPPMVTDIDVELLE